MRRNIKEKPASLPQLAWKASSARHAFAGAGTGDLSTHISTRDFIGRGNSCCTNATTHRQRRRHDSVSALCQIRKRKRPGTAASLHHVGSI
jgi:hypothetical protein